MSIPSTLSFVFSKRDSYNYQLFEKPSKREIRTSGGIAYKTIVCIERIIGSVISCVPLIVYGFYRCAISQVFFDSFVGLCFLSIALCFIFTSCYWCTCVSDVLSYKCCQSILKSRVKRSILLMMLFIIAGVVLICTNVIALGLIFILCGFGRVLLSFLCQLIALG